MKNILVKFQNCQLLQYHNLYKFLKNDYNDNLYVDGFTSVI